jgi:hypothetical protein
MIMNKISYKEAVRIDNALHDLGSKRCDIDLAKEIAEFRNLLKIHVQLYTSETKKIEEVLSQKQKHSNNEDYQLLDEEDKLEWKANVKSANKEIEELQEKEVENLDLSTIKLSKSLLKSSEEKYGDNKKYGDLAFYISGNTYTELINFIK